MTSNRERVASEDSANSRSKTMVDIPSRGMQTFEHFVADRRRFPEMLSAEECGRQVDERDKFVKRLNLKDFRPSEETDFEDWVDVAARQVQRHRIAAVLFQEAWESVAIDFVAEIIGGQAYPESYEALVDDVARRLFPYSDYVVELEDKLLVGSQRDTVMAAEHWLWNTCARYARLCKRRDRQINIGSQRLTETAERCLPHAVRLRLREERFRGTVQELFSAAYEVESSLRRLHKDIPQPLSAMPAEKRSLAEGDVAASATKKFKKLITGRCSGCGEDGHFYKTCKFRNYKCRRCGKPGHIEKACRSVVEKDSHERVRAVYTPKPGATELKVYKDRTVRDKLYTAEDVINMLRKIAEKRAKSSSERARKKLGRKKRPIKPTMVTEKDHVESQSESSGSNTEESNSECDTLERLVKQFDCFHSKCGKHGNVKVPAEVNGVRVLAVADTGAAVSMCGSNLAEILRLRLTDESISFKGLGKADGMKSEAVDLQIGARTIRAPLYVVKDPEFPLLIGTKELAEFDLYVDPVTGCVCCRDTREVVAVSQQDRQGIKSKVRGNTVSGINEKLSDTAIVTSKGIYEFNVLPFGIKNSPGEYQRAMDIVLGDSYGKGVLCYIDDIVIYGHTLSDTFTLFKWDTREREAYAIEWSLERFQDYIKGARTIVLTDHQSLQWMKTCSSGKVQRWALYFQQFDLEIVHLQGKYNVISDWLSRSCPEEETDADDQVEKVAVPLYVVGTPYVPDLNTIRTYQKDSPEVERKLWKSGEDDLLYYARNSKLYIPRELRDDFLYWFHASRYGGHCGINRTVRRMSKWIWWPEMRKNVGEYIQRCPTCNLKEKKVSRTSGMMGVLDRPYPMQLVSLDYVGPRTWNNKQAYYLVIIDHATRFVVTSVCEELTAAAAKKVFRERWISISGVPDVVLTDRGGAFRATEFNEYIVNELGCYHMFTSPYYPQGNGINEVCHAGLENTITGVALTPGVGATFEEVLSDATIVHNSVPHISSGYSPSYSMFGYELRLPGFQEYCPLAGEGDVIAMRERVADDKRAKYTDLAEKAMRPLQEETYVKGDVVVFILSDYEKQRYSKAFANRTSYTPNWSLPHEVVEVVDKILHCSPVGGNEAVKGVVRQVPLRQARKLKLPVPGSLSKLDWSQLQYNVPHRPWKRPIPNAGVKGFDWHARDQQQAHTQGVGIEGPSKTRKL